MNVRTPGARVRLFSVSLCVLCASVVNLLFLFLFVSARR